VRSFAFSAFIALALFSAPALAAMDEATKTAAADCQNTKIEPQKGIAACTKVLDGVKMKPANRTALLYYRAAFHMTANEDEKAKADYTAAIDTYEKDATKADWSSDFVGLVASSYGFLGQYEVKAKNCDAAKADFGKAAATEREVSQRAQYEEQARKGCK
jgi:hypothetical protein